KEKLLPFLLFESSHSPTELTTLKSYVERIKPEQTVSHRGDAQSHRKLSPSEAPRQKGYEVLYLSDPVDELLVQSVYEFEGNRLKSVTKGKVHLGTKEERKQREEQLKKKEEECAGFLNACQKNFTSM